LKLEIWALQMSETETVQTGTTETGSRLRKFFLKLGGVLAIVLHPVFLFFYFVLFMQFTIASVAPDPHFWIIILIALVLTVLLPLLFTLLFTKDPFLNNRKKRSLPLIFTLGCLYGCYVLFCQFIIPRSSEDSYLYSGMVLNIYLKILVFQIIGLIFLLIINLSYKISLHAYGIGFIMAVVFMHFFQGGILYVMSPHYMWSIWERILPIYSQIFFGIVILFFMGVVLWQRAASGSHKVMEVFWGFVFGFVLISLLIFIEYVLEFVE